MQRRTWTIEPRHRAVFLEGVARPGPLPRAPARVSALARRLPRARGVAPGGRRRLRVEHVRRRRPPRSGAAGGASRTSSSSRATSATPGPAGGVRSRRRSSLGSWAARRRCSWWVGSRARRCSRAASSRSASRSSPTRSTWTGSAPRPTASRAAATSCAPRSALAPDDVAVLSVARLAPEKGLDTLVRAVAAAGDRRLVLVLASVGPERERSWRSQPSSACGSSCCPTSPWERIAERYALADVFALLSRHEPWGVVVNEAAASGLPLVLSDRVGAAFDLLEDGRNGALVPADDPVAAGAAIRASRRRPRATPRAPGRASRDLMRGGATSRASRTSSRSRRRVAGASAGRAPPRRARAARRRRRPTTIARRLAAPRRRGVRRSARRAAPA